MVPSNQVLGLFPRSPHGLGARDCFTRRLLSVPCRCISLALYSTGLHWVVHAR